MNYLQLIKKHHKELQELRTSCEHPKDKLLLRLDRSVVGAGSAHPSVHVICPNCGSMKIMFRHGKECGVPLIPTLKRQNGIKDQRLDLYVTYEHEVLPPFDNWDAVNEAIHNSTSPSFSI